MTWVGSGSVMAASSPSRGSPDEPAGVDTCRTADLEPALAAISVVDSTHRMQHPDPSPPSCESPCRETLEAVAAGRPCPSCLPARPWQNVLLLVAGAILAPGKRTCHRGIAYSRAAAGDRFPNLSWCAQQGCMVVPRRRRLAAVSAGRHFPQSRRRRGDWDRRYHQERRAGAENQRARHLPRSGPFFEGDTSSKTSGLRWLSAQLLVHIPWVGRIMGLLFLTVLAPSKRFYADKPRSPKTLLDWACSSGCIADPPLAARPPDCHRRSDTAFAAVDFLGAVRNYVSVVTRLRLDANLYAPATTQTTGPGGRPAVKGKRLPTLTQVLHDAGTVWQTPAPSRSVWPHQSCR